MTTTNDKSTAVEMKRLHSEQVAPEKMAAFKRAVSTKNPLALQSFEERGASIAAKVDRIQNNEKYKALSPEAKAKVRADMYDKYVAPSYKGFHLEAPSKEAWVRLTSREDRLGNTTGANAYFQGKGQQAATNAAFGADKALSGVGLFGLKVSNKMFQELHGITKSFSAHLPQSFQDVDTHVQKSIQRLQNEEQHHLEDNQVWLKSHYRDSALNSLSNMAGEFIATLPIYEAVGGMLGKAGKVGNLSEKLSATPLGKWTSGTLKVATEGYLGALVTSGGDKKEAAMGGVGGAVLHGAGAPIAEKIASFPLIKKWTASILAMGGKPFAQDLAASAMHEESAYTDHLEQEIEHGKLATVSRNPTVGTADTQGARGTVFKHNADMGNGVIIHSNLEGKGYISFAGVDRPFTSTQERQEIYNQVAKMAETSRMVADPLTGQLHHAEKLSQNSIAQQMYGKSLRNLGAAQRKRVLETRLRLIGEAAEEAPVHLPELAEAEVQHDIDTLKTEMPETHGWLQSLEKEFGEPIAKAVIKENGKKVALETGIINPAAVKEKLTAEPKTTKAKLKSQARAEAAGKSTANAEYEPKEDESVSFNAMRQDTIAYFKKGETPGRRASDGTLIGKRDKRTWNEILKSDNLKAFVDVLKEADGDRIKFENPLHRMLFHYSNRDGLSKEMNAKLVREIRKYTIKNKNIAEKWTADQIKTAADNVVLHAYEMSKGGQLASKEPFFHSTNVNPDWSPTQWQMQLHTENDDEQMQFVRDTLKRHPKQLKQVLSGMKTLVRMKYDSNSLEKYLELDSAIRDMARTAVVSAKKGRK